MLGVRKTFRVQVLVTVLVLAVDDAGEACRAQACSRRDKSADDRCHIRVTIQVPQALMQPQRP